MFGWTGKVLRVDLAKLSWSAEDLDRKAAEQYIGGLGLGAKYLYEEIDPAVDPYAPENKLIFATGPLTGTGAPAGNRYVVVTKSPLTGGIANSTAAGEFGTNLKYAGWDLVIFEGKSAKPVYLFIDDDRVSFHDATALWGQDTEATEQAVVALTAPDAKVACIGPAGENLVRFACVINDMGRAAGRSGVGAVMGSKNLKAIAVRGTGGVKVADAERFVAGVASCYATLDDPYTEHFHQTGTPACSSSCTPTAQCRPRTSSWASTPSTRSSRARCSPTPFSAQAHGHGLSRLPHRLRPRQPHHQSRLRGHRRRP